MNKAVDDLNDASNIESSANGEADKAKVKY